MNFKNLTKEDIKLLDTYLENSHYVGSDFSYYGYLIWFDCEYAIEGNYLFIRAFFGDKLRYWPPLIKGEGSIVDAIKHLPKDATFTSFTEDQIANLSDEYNIFTKREWSEYIYKSSDFIAQVGKKYAQMRNQIIKFKSLYDYTIEPYKLEDRTEIEDFEKNWLEKRVFDTDYQKISAIEESGVVLNEIAASLDGLTICDVLRVEGAIVGFTVGEIMPSGNAIVYIEKANTEYEGIYSFLSHEFAFRHFSSCEYINRQEDMGIEDIRNSKLSYNPSYLLDKYILLPKDHSEYNPKPCFVADPFFSNSIEIRHLYDNIDIQETIKSAQLDDYKLRKLSRDDYNSAMSFFKCGISRLEDKKFFLNYTDNELIDVLSRGSMFGLFFDDHLIATAAVDLDKEYGNNLKEICDDKEDIQYYEFSGTMVCPYHRQKGLSNYLCRYAIDYAKKNLSPCVLCSVVQYNNVPSIKNLTKLGFVEVAQKQLNEYNFRYLTLKI